MSKIARPPRGPEAGSSWPLFYPFTPALFTCRGKKGRVNIMPALGQCILGRAPLTVGVSICRRYYNEDYWERFSYQLALEALEFVCNIPAQEMAEKVSACGAISGHEEGDKFAAVGLTPLPAHRVSAPLIAECPINLECEVRQILNVGSHDMFVGEVVMIHVDAEIAAGKKELVWDDLPCVVKE